MTDSEPIAPEVTKLIELFSEEPALKFPDLDAGALREAAARVEQRNEALKEVEGVLQKARAALEEEQESLLRKAQRAQAYLKVYSESDPALGSRVDAIVLPRSRRGPRADVGVAPVDGESAPKKRGRPRKIPSTAASLFAGDDDTEGRPGVDSAPVLEQH